MNINFANLLLYLSRKLKSLVSELLARFVEGWFLKLSKFRPFLIKSRRNGSIFVLHCFFILTL